MRQCGGLWCRCYLSSHLDNPLALGLCSPEQQHARREKMGLLSFILTLMAGVGFTEAVHGTLATRFHGVLSSRDSVLSMPIVIHGYRYDFKPLPQWDSMAFPWRCHKSLWFNHNWCKQFSRFGICPPTSIAVYKVVVPTRSVTSLGPISASQQRLIHYWVRWWDRLARFTIPGMMSRILIETWQSSGCMYSCLILYCSNQRSPASSVLDLQTRLARSISFLSGSVFADNPCPFSLINVVPQSPPEYGLFNFPLAHSICLVTAYSKPVGVYGLPEHPQAYHGHRWWYG